VRLPLVAQSDTLSPSAEADLVPDGEVTLFAAVIATCRSTRASRTARAGRTYYRGSRSQLPAATQGRMRARRLECSDESQPDPRS